MLLSGNTQARCLLSLVLVSAHLPALGQLFLPVMLGKEVMVGKEQSSLSLFLTAAEGQPRQGQQGAFLSEAQSRKRTYLLITNKCSCGTSQTQVFLWR